MASLTDLSPTNTRLTPSWPSENNSSSFREASFSSYLSNSEETYIRTLVESTQNHGLHSSRHQKKVEDGEIDVFSADKYFNTEVQERNNSSVRSRSAKFQGLEFDEDRANKELVRVHSSKHLKVQPRTPSSTQSELSSNSQSALLKRSHRTPSRISTSEGNNNVNNNSIGKAQGHGIISLLSCSCCVKKSVDIEREVTNNYQGGGLTELGYSKGVSRSIKTSLDTADITRLNKLRVLDNPDSFVFPPIPDSPILKKPNQEEDLRKSLDVFGSSDLDEGSKRFSLQKRLNMLPWDAIPIQRPITTEENNTSNAPSETYKDTESDASSDLFEIECLSCSANPVNLQGSSRVLPSDGSVTPTTGYAPSEASIEWSVVTASAADFSLASDSEDQRSSYLTSITRHKIGSKSISSGKMSSMNNKEVQKQVSSNLLGCKSQKAVNVAREVYRKSPKSESQRIRRVSDSFGPVTRFQAEAKLGGFGHRQRQSLSPDLLYIQ